jgi:hypothetical protein
MGNIAGLRRSAGSILIIRICAAMCSLGLQYNHITLGGVRLKKAKGTGNMIGRRLAILGSDP